MTERITITGGARIGFSNATWPFAKLEISQDRLTVSAGFIGACSFRKEDIVAIYPYRGIFSQGIKITHNLKKYNKHVVFWSFRKPSELISLIEQVGFWPPPH